MARRRAAGRRANGNGHVASKAGKDGRWRGSVLLGYDENGKEIRKWVSGRTRPEVADEVTRLLSEQAQGVDIGHDGMLVREFINEWLKGTARNSVSDLTWTNYELHVRLYILPSLGRIVLRELTPQHVQAMHTAQARKGKKPATVRYTNMVLRGALRVALSWGLVTRNVAALVTLPPVRNEPRQALTEKQLRTFIRSIRGHRLEAFFILDFLHGLRRGEMCALRWEDVNLDVGVLAVTGSLRRVNGQLRRREPKTARSAALVYLSPVAVDALRRHLELQSEEREVAGERWTESGYVFTTRWGTLIEPRNVNWIFSKLLLKAGLPHAGVHLMRHTSGSLMFSQGSDLKEVSEALHHSRVGTTADIYIHLYDPQRRAAADRIGKVIASLDEEPENQDDSQTEGDKGDQGEGAKAG